MDDKTERLRKLIRDYPHKTRLAKEAGCTPDALRKFGRGDTLSLRYSLLQKLFDILRLTEDGKSVMPLRRIRARVDRSRQLTEMRMFKMQQTLSVLPDSPSPDDKSFFIPDDIDISEEEAFAVLLSRESKHAPVAVAALMADLSDAAKRAIAQIADEDFVGAIMTLTASLGKKK